uniref:MIP32529p1 n=1 Tax=Drosophila melanogaster TaxID=7227 RepID=G7H818_DROME|nr:MIP32529p1 [Drosophila melanogaster]
MAVRVYLEDTSSSSGDSSPGISAYIWPTESPATDVSTFRFGQTDTCEQLSLQ